MTLVNVQLANVISDVAGVTGQKIVCARVAGKRGRAQIPARSWR